MPLRRLGIFAESRPTKKTQQVVAARFSIGGVIGQFERKYNKVFQVSDAVQAREIFGGDVASYYGPDFVRAFFQNVANVSAELWIKSHVGNTGTATDATVASAMIVDALSANTIQMQAAYQEELEYGQSGLRTGRKITRGYRFTTTLAANVAASDTSAQLASVIGIKVGDLVQFDVTGGPVVKKITVINESTKTISWSGVFHASLTGTTGDTTGVIGFTVQTYRKSLTGVVTEVETELGKVFCTLEPEVTDFYIQNVHAANKWLKFTDQASVSPLAQAYPPSDSAVVYNSTGGSDGTAPTTASHWNFDNLAAFNEAPIRFLANTESTLTQVNIDGETYCKGRDDMPKWIYNIPSDRTKAQKITIGQSYQRSDDVVGVICDNWLEVDDPFSNSPIAPPRKVPNVGFVMGAWIRAIETLGIHYIPAVQQITLSGCRGVVGTQLKSDLDRTDVASAGVNSIQAVVGAGIVIKDFFTPSTTLEFQFANGILMREFFKVSFKDSLKSSVNTPNSIGRIKEDKTAIYNFYRRIWEAGSTGNVPTGESFGQAQRDDGSSTQFDDHIQVQADTINNPQTSINAGQRNLDSWFTFPSPAGSIRIGVGLALL